MVLLLHGGDLELTQWLVIAAVGLAVSIGVVVAFCLAARAYMDYQERKK